MASTGIGTGIGIGLGEIGDTLERRREEGNFDREKQADALHTKAIQIGTNLLNKGYKVALDPTSKQPALYDTKTGAVAQNPDADTQSMYDQYLSTSQQAQALFPPHESGALIQHFRKFMGKQAKAPEANPRAAEFTPESMAGEVPVPKPPTQAYTGETGQIMQLLKAASDPSLTAEQRSAAKTEYDRLSKTQTDWQKAGEPYLDKTTQRYYQPYVDPKDPSKQKTVQLPAHFQPTGTAKAEAAKPEESEIVAEAKMWAESGIKPPTKTLGPVTKYMAEHNLKPLASHDNSPEGRLAKALIDSGQATPDDATGKAAKMIVDAQKAKEKAASGTSNLTQAEATALAQSDIILGRTTSFGLGKSGDRDTYNRAKADLMIGGGLGGLLGAKADVTATRNALSRLQTMKASVGAFQKTLNANLDQVLQQSQQVGRSGSSLANEYMQYLQGKLTDYPELQKFRVAVNTAANEYGRITNSATGGGVSTDSARGEALSLLNTALAEGALQGTVQQMRVDSENRIKGMDETATGLEQQIRGIGPSGTPSKVIKFEDLPK